MGQYHEPVCIETEEGLNPLAMNSGTKEWEQLHNKPGTTAAMVALVCARGGNMPADCSQSPLVGKWAAKRVLVQGDYAEDDDIPDWDGPALSLLYGAIYPHEEGEPTRPLYFTDITEEARNFLEGACNIRYFSQRETWTTRHGNGSVTESGYTSWHHVFVQPSGKHFGNCGVAEYVIDPEKHDARSLEWLKKCGMQPIDVQRVPRSGDWHGIRCQDMTEGHRRVIVNLDTMEYLDPVAFGHIPTLAGMVNKPTNATSPLLAGVRYPEDLDIGGALFALLCHREPRGGGDLPAKPSDMDHFKITDDPRGELGHLFVGLEHIKGRWRGGRILGTSEFNSEDLPSTEEVIEKGVDISLAVLQYLVAVDTE